MFLTEKNMYWRASLLLILFLRGSRVAGQASCPFTAEEAANIDFSKAVSACEPFNSQSFISDERVCKDCICSLVSIIFPELAKAGYELNDPASVLAAEDILRACAFTFSSPLASQGLPLISLMRLSECQNIPDCIAPYVPQQPPPADYSYTMDTPRRSNEKDVMAPNEPFAFESSNGAVKGSCSCTSEFDPVCDYYGGWYINFCEANCKNVIVERCSPVFQKIDTKRKSFVLTEDDGSFIWFPSCACPTGDDYIDPVCDVFGKQYISPCYAKCQGVLDVFECESLVIDFELSGEGPIVVNNPPRAAAPPSTNIISDSSSKALPRPNPNPNPNPYPNPNPPINVDYSNKNNNNKREKDRYGQGNDKRQIEKTIIEDDVDVDVSVNSNGLRPEVTALFRELGMDMSSFPPELTYCAYKVIKNQPITDAELKRAREIIADKEMMSHIRESAPASFSDQINLFSQNAIGNNKIFLEEFSKQLSEHETLDSHLFSTDMASLEKCYKQCVPGIEVCSVLQNEVFASSCHARCAGVTDTKPCPKKETEHESSGSMPVPPSALVLLLISYFFGNVLM